jgi:hypothetical protein
MESEMRRLGIGLASLVLMTLPAAAAYDVPDATVEFSGGSVAAGIGYTWGTGMLVYQGRLFRLQVAGLSIADIGVTSYRASGDVYNLKTPSDILGTYSAITAGATIGSGISGTAMQNEHGVVIRMTAFRAGLSLTLAPSGMAIRGLRQEESSELPAKRALAALGDATMRSRGTFDRTRKEEN